MKNPAKLGALMDQREVELAAALEAAEEVFNDRLPPLHASVCLLDVFDRTRKGRVAKRMTLYYGDYDDKQQWGFYVRDSEGFVPLSTGTREQKIQAAGALKALFHAVVCAAERQIADIEKATATVVALIKALEETQ